VNQIFVDACKSQSLFTAKGASEDDELGPDFGRLIDQMERAARRDANLGIITSTQSEQPSGRRATCAPATSRTWSSRG